MKLLKKNIIYILLCLIGIFPITTSALTYESTFVIGVRNIENTQANIDKAKLLEKYATEYRKETKELVATYNIPNSPILTESILQIEKMILTLKKIQTKSIEKQDADEILSSVIQKLKEINVSLKPYLKKQQQIYNQNLLSIKSQYIDIWEKISWALYFFIQELSIKLWEKPSLTSKEKEVVMSLIRLNESRKKIKDFKTISFNSKNDMRNYYLGIIRTIQRELQAIKSLLK